MTTEESQIVCERLDAAGIDLIELSGGTYEQTGFEHKKESTKAREAFCAFSSLSSPLLLLRLRRPRMLPIFAVLEFAEALKPKIKTALVAVTGGFRSKKAIEQALESGACDIVGFGRPLTAEPTLIITDMIAGKTEAAKENKVVRRSSSLSLLPRPERRLTLSPRTARRCPNRYRHRADRCHLPRTAHSRPLHSGGRRRDLGRCSRSEAR